MILQTTALWMNDHGSHLPIAYAFESGNQFWNEANDILAGIGKHPDLKRMFRYRTHFPMDKKESFGLQAADLLAWLMTRTDVGSPKNQTMKHFAPHFLELMRGDDSRYQAFHPKGNLLKQFFDENAQPNPYRVVVDLTRAKKARLR
jgi:hypothetical protein